MNKAPSKVVKALLLCWVEYQVHIQHSSVFVFPFGTAATIYQILKLNEYNTE